MTAAAAPGPGFAGGAHVLAVDDDARLRRLLRRYLGDNGFVVATARDAADARAKLASLSFDILVLDVMMPGEDGAAFARALRAEGADPPILMLTAMDDPEARIAGLESGADDYLAKPFEPRELALRLRAILRRARARSARRPVRFGRFAFDPATGAFEGGAALTASETGLLRALAERPGEAVSRAALGAATQVAERSVDVRIARLRRKIEPDPRRPRYLATVRGAGYVLHAE